MPVLRLTIPVQVDAVLLSRLAVLHANRSYASPDELLVSVLRRYASRMERIRKGDQERHAQKLRNQTVTP